MGVNDVTVPPVITRFLAAIAALDAAEAAACFAPDGVYAYAVPHPPAIGRDAIRGMFAGLLGSADKARWDLTTVTCSGPLVWLERVDRFWFNGREVAIECAGIVEVDGDRIRELRDYVDLQTWQTRRGAA